MTDGPRADGPARGRRAEVLRVLADAADPLTVFDVAAELGVHANTVRWHLDALLEQGRVEQVRPDRCGPGRPPVLYRAVPKMDPAGPRNYHFLAAALVTGLAAGPDPAGQALAAGRAQGRALAAADGGAARRSPVSRLVDLLDELGFAPERRREGGHTQIGLRNCPFLELAEPGSAVVCSLHLGVMQGALEEWGADVTADQLEPFVAPDLCLARLTKRR